MKLWLCFVCCYLGLVCGESASWLCSGVECPEAADEQFLNINGTRVVAGGVAAQYARLDCGGLPLSDPALPRRAPDAPPLARLTLVRCRPPAAGLGAALAALGVRGLRRLTMTAPPRGEPGDQLLAGLPAGLALELVAAPGEAAAALPAAALAGAALRELRLTRVPLAAPALGALPPALRLLSLTATGLTALPGAALRRLPALASLSLREPALREAPDLVGSAVTDLFVEAPVPGVPLGAAVVAAAVWGATGVRLLGPCGALRSLTLGRCGGSVPADWLSGCAALEAVSLEACAAAHTLSAAALGGPRALAALALRRAALAALPGDLLALAPRLRALDVSHNKLRDLPELGSTLTSLVVAHNALSSGSLRGLGALRSLQSLDASYNPLNDTCGDGAGDGAAVWAPGAAGAWAGGGLRRLALRGAGLTRVCGAWRRARGLLQLDLRDNRITELDRASLQWAAGVAGGVAGGGAGGGAAGGAERVARSVDLRGNPLRSLRYSQRDYEELRALPPPDQPLTTIRADGALQCDCGVYWAAAARRHIPAQITATCRQPPELAGRSLWSLPLSSLACPLPAARCAAGCACEWRDAAPRARCRNVTAFNLTLLPADIQSVDLAGAGLLAAPAGLRAAAARRLVLSLSHNALACSCLARAELSHASAQIEDWAQVRCSDGSIPVPCGAGGWRGAGAVAAVLGGAVLLLTLLLSALLAARRWLPERLQGKLAALLPGSMTQDDTGRTYDVFIAHANNDWSAAARIAEIVETGGRRALLHWRDWPAGAAIAASIQRSATAARYTAVLLSPALAESTWAACELEAATPSRVLPILLSPLPETAPPQLLRLLTTHTYLHYADVRFEEKLLTALGGKKARKGVSPPPVGAPVDAPPPPPYITPPSG